MRNTAKKSMPFLLAALLAGVIAASPAAAQDNSLKRIPFGELPAKIQKALVRDIPDPADVETSRAYKGTRNGKDVFVGRLSDFDGWSETVTLNKDGKLLEATEMPPEWKRK